MSSKKSEQTKESSVGYVVITPEEFDPDRVVMDRPITQKFVINKVPLEVTKSANWYLDENDEKKQLFVQAPSQRIGEYGLKWSHPLQIPEDQRTRQNAEGMQLCYPMTSMETVKRPTKEEQAFMDMVDKLFKLQVEHAKKVYAENEDMPDDKKFLPGPSETSIAMQLGAKVPNWKNCVKYPFERPKKKDGKEGEKDDSKPFNMYSKLAKVGKAEKLVIKTKFWVKVADDETGDERVEERPASSYEGRPGIVTPIFMLDDSYWGLHGSKSKCGVSVRLTLLQADFEETAGGRSVPAERLVRGGPQQPAKLTATSKKSIKLDGDDEDETQASGPLSSSEKPKAATKPAAKKASAAVESDEESPKPTKKPAPKKPAVKKPVVDSDDDEPVAPVKPAKKPVGKKKVVVASDDDE